MENKIPVPERQQPTDHLYDVIIIGGSYSGLAAAITLGRSLRRVLVIDSGLPCNRFAPHSHNFITQDGVPPAEIAAKARKQAEAYPTVSFLNDLVTAGTCQSPVFAVNCQSGKSFRARKLLFTTGLKDLLPDIAGFREGWGKSIVHCPYCHGYELRQSATAIIGNGDAAMHYAQLLLNWTNKLSLFTNGPEALTATQRRFLESNHIQLYTALIEKLSVENGQVTDIVIREEGQYLKQIPMQAIYCAPPTEQSCKVPEMMGCALNEQGLLETDATQATTVKGIYAAGDNEGFRLLARAAAHGAIAGASINFALIEEDYPL